MVKRGFHLPFDPDLFGLLAMSYPTRVVGQAKHLLLADDEIHKNPGEYLGCLIKRIGGKPPGVSVPPDTEELKALSKLMSEYRCARKKVEIDEQKFMTVARELGLAERVVVLNAARRMLLLQDIGSDPGARPRPMIDVNGFIPPDRVPEGTWLIDVARLAQAYLRACGVSTK